MNRAIWLAASAALSAQLLVAKVDKEAQAKDKAAQQAAMLRIRKIYVQNPHIFGYIAPGRLKKEIAKSDCLTLEPSPSRADAVLMPVAYESWLDAIGNGRASLATCDGSGCSTQEVHVGNSTWRWVLLDPKTGRPISEWTMKSFPNAKKVEAAVGCRK
ncbi:MAG TPA: hypothetical protein VMX16_08700 [Terriglobia bacterium]|nr:hypothetical protein [Terriglobia bacterium]